jgi:hypothetical protein
MIRQIKFNPLEFERNYLKITKEEKGVVVGHPIFIRCDKVEVIEFNYDRAHTKCLLFKLHGKRHLIKNSDTSFTVSTDPAEITAFNKGLGWYSSYTVEIVHKNDYAQIENQFETVWGKV